MKNWKLSPTNPYIAKYVECYWLLEKEADDLGNDYPKLYPDPSAHIIIARDNCQYHYNHESVEFNGSGSHCLYPHRNTYVMDHSEPFLILGIKLMIGALYSVNLALDKAVMDKVVAVNVTDQFGFESFNFEEILIKPSAHPQEITNILDEILLPHLQDCLEDRHSELVRRALNLLSDTPVSELGAALNCSQRTIERSFLRVTKLTLKQCQSMLNFEKILEHLYKQEVHSIDWLNVAYEFGFSDQPHLIRHLKECIGSTPTQYAKQRDLTIDIYGNFEFD